MKPIDCPCKYCTKETGRYPGCHDHCDKPEYLDWREQLKQKRVKQVNERNLFYFRSR